MNAVLSSRVAAGLGCCGAGGLFEKRRRCFTSALPDGGQRYATNHYLCPSDVAVPYATSPSYNNSKLSRGIDTERSHRTILLPWGGETGGKVILPLGMKIKRRFLRRDAQAVRVQGKYQSGNKLFDSQGEVQMDVMLHRYGGVVASERARKMFTQNKHLVTSCKVFFRNAHVVHLHEPSGTLEDKKMSFFGVCSLIPPGGGLNSASKGFDRLSVFVDMEGGDALDLHLTMPSQFCEKEENELLEEILDGLMLEQNNNRGSSASHVPCSPPSAPNAQQLFRIGMQCFEQVVTLGAGDQGVRLHYEKKSLEYLRKAYELESKLPICERMTFKCDWRTLVMHLGMLLCSMGELDEATDVLSHACNEDIAFPGHRYSLACVHGVAGRFQEALCELETAYRLQLIIPEKSQVLLSNPLNEWCFKELKDHPGMERIAHLYLGKTLSC